MNRSLCLLIALAVAGPAAPRTDDIGARIASDAAAAQRLQGSLDGTWTLSDAKGRALIVLQIADPVTGEDLQAAWRDVATGGMGVVTRVRRLGGALTLSIDDRGATTRISLRRINPDTWRGALSRSGRASAVILRRAP